MNSRNSSSIDYHERMNFNFSLINTPPLNCPVCGEAREWTQIFINGRPLAKYPNCLENSYNLACERNSEFEDQ